MGGNGFLLAVIVLPPFQLLMANMSKLSKRHMYLWQMAPLDVLTRWRSITPSSPRENGFFRNIKRCFGTLSALPGTKSKLVTIDRRNARKYL